MEYFNAVSFLVEEESDQKYTAFAIVLLIIAKIIADVKICMVPSDPCTSERMKGSISETPTIADTASNPELPTVDFTNPVITERTTKSSAKPMAGRISNGFCKSGTSDSDAGISFRVIRSDRITPTAERRINLGQRIGRNVALMK